MMQLALDSVARCAAAWQRERHDNAAERARAAAIAAPLRRAQFLAGRWLAAQLLAQQCGGRPAQWLITSASGEAPRVLDGPGRGRPHLSLAHRADVVACALADTPLGVDIELEGSLRGPADERAEFILSDCEHAEFANLEPDARDAFLLARWTLKEAWAKQSASGQGLGLGQMRGLAARALTEGGNARLWAAQGIVVALCSDTPGRWPQAGGKGLDEVPAQCWQLGPVDHRH
jgi:4'-phosphopantetheinyl transferase